MSFQSDKPPSKNSLINRAILNFEILDKIGTFL